MQIGTRDGCTHRLIDELSHRDTHAFAGRVFDVELDFLDRRGGLRHAIVCFLQLREIGCKQSTVLDIAEDQLTLQRRDAKAQRGLRRREAPGTSVEARERARGTERSKPPAVAPALTFAP
jgi:hypothetical protein